MNIEYPKKRNPYINVLLEQYSQANEHIRNYRTVHWQIASVLYLYMVGIIGYGLPNVEGWKGILCIVFSALLIFILHVTTYLYFQLLHHLKTEELKIIEEKFKENEIDFVINEEKQGDLFGLCPREMSSLWRNHPEFGFVCILFALILFATGIGVFPEHHNDTSGDNSSKSEMLQNRTQNVPTNPNDLKINPKVSEDGKGKMPLKKDPTMYK